MRRLTAVLVAAVLAAGCVEEPTGPDAVPGYITWVEWPTAVTTSQPGALRVSGSVPCGYRVWYRVSVDSSGIHLAAEGRDPVNAVCPASPVSGSLDTLLPLPRLDPPSYGLPAAFGIWAPVWTSGYSGSTERLVGSISLQATADTTTKFAGHVLLYADSADCWRARPYSSFRYPGWVFAKPVPLQGGTYQGYLSGWLVAVYPPICGDTVAIHARTLEVDATPWAVGTRSQ